MVSYLLTGVESKRELLPPSSYRISFFSMRCDKQAEWKIFVSDHENLLRSSLFLFTNVENSDSQNVATEEKTRFEQSTDE